MKEPLDLESIQGLCDQARAHFSMGVGPKAAEINRVLVLFGDAFGSISSIYTADELAGTRQEAAIAVLAQAVETVLAMYFLSQDGFWDNALALKRNYCELLIVAMAIGYDQQCFTDWENERSNFSSFKSICRRVEHSSCVPDLDKSILPVVKAYWAESSQRYSHHVRRSSVRTLVKDGQVRFEPKVATHEFQQTRMNTARAMILNVVSVLLGVTDFSQRAYDRRDAFPAGAGIIARANACFGNETWKHEQTN